MPVYCFKCKGCERYFEAEFTMEDEDGRNNLCCPDCKEVLNRVFTAPAMIIKENIRNVVDNLKPSEAVIDCDGKPIKLNFIDHKDRSQLAQESLLNSIPGARMDEKTGKPVVDVVSSIKDPLGALERSKKKYPQTKETVNVNQKYKTKK